MAYNIKVQDITTKEVKVVPLTDLYSAIDDSFVSKVTGKDLSTNDFTDALETKLNDLPLAADLPADISELTDTTNLIPTVADTPVITHGVAAPTTTPGKIGDTFIDTSASKFYFAKGVASSSDWVIAN